MKKKNCGVFIKGNVNLQDSVDKNINRSRFLNIEELGIDPGNEMLESITGLPHDLAIGTLGLMESVTIAAAYSKCFNTPWIVDTSNIDPIELSVVAMIKKYDVKEEFIRRFGSEEKFLKDHTKIKPSKISKELSELSDLLTCMVCNNADKDEFRRFV